jgi:hypothetical protein
MKRSDSVVELEGLLKGDGPSDWIANLWTTYNNQRAPKINQWKELDEYIFATDTTTTSNSTLPWTHNTTSPKLTQIRDNLHANYLSSLFPNDKWLSWVAFSKDAAKKETSKTILAYMDNKTREGGLRNTVSRLLYDYIDKGNAFSMPTFEARYNTSDFQMTTDFVGPKAVRISPHDIVFDPTAVDFSASHKIVRSYMTVGDLKKMAQTHPDQSFWEDALQRRRMLADRAGAFKAEDWAKASQYMMDGFGNMQEYYQSNTVEILEFYGDYYDSETDVLEANRMITVVDRTTAVRNVPIPTYGGRPAIRHVGWRVRPENLWAMGPLDNLVGMQYMIDHYLNMSANALDLKVMPPKKIIGDVESFAWEPNAEIHLDENGDVQEMAQNFGDVYTVLEYISQLEERMEMYAGAPREAMGIRTPGEKTAFEMQSLENAAGRIFNEKIIQFEVFLEQILNDMLEEAHRNIEKTDIIRIVDNDLGVEQFKSVTKDDITANGILRPVGARHFGQRAQELQNLTGVLQGPMAQILAPHTSAIGLTEFISDVIDLRGYTVFQPNIAVSEAQETEALATQAQEDNLMASQNSEEEAMMEQAMMGAQADAQ